MFGNCQGINPMGLIESLADLKKQYFTNMKMSLTFLK